MDQLKQYFLLRPDITYLNFGSFGACPKPIFEKYQQYQVQLEQEPVLFITKEGLSLLEKSREALGSFINCDKDDLVYVPNPTYAVNMVVRNLPLQPGDEILATDLEYGACDKTWEYYSRKNKFLYKKSRVQLPLTTKEKFVEDLFKDITPATKLIFFSHITSSTALRFPAEEICRKAHEMRIPVFIDGAHAPAQCEVDLRKLGVDFYAGACHKWMMAPKGCSFIYAKKQWQSQLDPLVISWGYDALFPTQSQFQDYHQMNGTRDFSAYLTIPAILDFMKLHNWPDVSARCRKLVKEYAPEFCEILQTEPLAPLTDDFILQMFSAKIRTAEPEKLHDLFFGKYKIEIPVSRHEGDCYIRYSINAFNDEQDMDHLLAAVKDIISTSNLIKT
jgi:isopenicillin-N epimerase